MRHEFAYLFLSGIPNRSIWVELEMQVIHWSTSMHKSHPRKLSEIVSKYQHHSLVMYSRTFPYWNVVVFLLLGFRFFILLYMNALNIVFLFTEIHVLALFWSLAVGSLLILIPWLLIYHIYVKYLCHNIIDSAFYIVHYKGPVGILFPLTVLDSRHPVPLL